ncbi:hypothetical protein FA15DRAFT_675309 [Coprinopsis marcescibilis]|uniref:F-box domain-containing protein n=1 Tax=Coprinopsis marcescibilis TaxID=230819 RepID=A0A5C3KEF2_COPMA|nr:hypothetical protein FA15DRAFT_675309 [Coprinopsis marcescibilis]
MSPSAISTIPELVASILSHLYADDVMRIPSIQACMQVSRVWHEESRPLLFHKTVIVMNATNEDAIRRRFLLFQELLSQDPRIAGYVQDFELHVEGFSTHASRRLNSQPDILPFAKTLNQLRRFCFRVDWDSGMAVHWNLYIQEVQDAIRHLCRVPTLDTLQLRCTPLPHTLWCHNHQLRSLVVLGPILFDRSDEPTDNTLYAPLQRFVSSQYRAATPWGVTRAFQAYERPGLIQNIREATFLLSVADTHQVQSFLNALSSHSLSKLFVSVEHFTNRALHTSLNAINLSRQTSLRTITLVFMSISDYLFSAFSPIIINTLSSLPVQHLEEVSVCITRVCQIDDPDGDDYAGHETFNPLDVGQEFDKIFNLSSFKRTEGTPPPILRRVKLHIRHACNREPLHPCSHNIGLYNAGEVGKYFENLRNLQHTLDGFDFELVIEHVSIADSFVHIRADMCVPGYLPHFDEED